MSNIVIPRGQHPYDLIVGANVRQAPILTVRQLRDLYPEDFEAASDALAPDEWRLLYEIHPFLIYALTNPAFDIVNELTLVFDDRQTMDGARHAQLRSDRDVDDIAATIRMALADLMPDQQKALWCIMCGAKQSDMSGEELLTRHWWKGWRTM